MQASVGISSSRATWHSGQVIMERVTIGMGLKIQTRE
jgi:hypothetical protein